MGSISRPGDAVCLEPVVDLGRVVREILVRDVLGLQHLARPRREPAENNRNEARDESITMKRQQKLEVVCCGPAQIRKVSDKSMVM